MDLKRKIGEMTFKDLLISSVIIGIFASSIFIGWILLTPDEEINVIIINSYDNETWVNLRIVGHENIPLTERIFNLNYGESYVYQLKLEKSHKILGVRITAYNSSNSPYKSTYYSPYADYIYWYPEDQHYNLIAVITPSCDIPINYPNDASYLVEKLTSSIEDIIFTKLQES